MGLNVQLPIAFVSEEGAKLIMDVMTDSTDLTGPVQFSLVLVKEIQKYKSYQILNSVPYFTFEGAATSSVVPCIRI